MTNLKKVAAIHDLSGIGKCSLTVIIPVLSAQGLQVCPVPTAVLSTHTGGFGEVVFHDLTDYILPTLEHYKNINAQFDCVYSGFLASDAQIHHCRRFFESFPSALKVVDPVMADHGKRYKTYTPEMCRRMGELVQVADVITPNLTEAAILLGEDYSPVLTQGNAKSWLAKLSEMSRIVVITSAQMADGNVYNIGYDRDGEGFWKVRCDFVPVSYPGTGDIFASVLTGSILSGESLPIAINRATVFTQIAVKTTYSYGTEPREGVMFESNLSWLSRRETLYDFERL